MLNVDQSELKKFEDLAHKWWDPNSEFKPLHDINPLRLNLIRKFVSIEDKDILDVGCGGGILAEGLAKNGGRVLGIDLADKPLGVAKLHSQESQVPVTYEKISAEELRDRERKRFDMITCMEMLEHVPNPIETVRACADLTRDGGWCFFSTIAKTPKAFLFAIFGAEYVLKLLPKGTHEFKKFIRPSDLSKMCRSSGLEIVDIVGMTYNPFTKVYSLGKDTDVNYTLVTRKV